MVRSQRIPLFASILLLVSLLLPLSFLHPGTASAATTIGCPPSESQGSNNDWVKVIQYRLNSLEDNDVYTFPQGTYPLATDGQFGSITKRVVLNYQQHFMGVSDGGGVVGSRTWASLGLCTGFPAQVPSGYTAGGSCPSTQMSGSDNTFVNALQHMLSMDKYEGAISNTSPDAWNFPLSFDGTFGSQTKSAVIDFQHANHLTEDGIVGNNTWKALGMCS